MIGQGRPLVLLAMCWFFSAANVDAFEPLSPKTRSQSAKPTPFQEDANLYDVQFVGQSIGWAVGDHGVVWQTTDGGRNWRFVKTPVNCPLKSVCFLTNRVGWIVGGGTTPFTGVSTRWLRKS